MNNFEYEYIDIDNSVITFWREDKKRDEVSASRLYRGARNPLAEEEAIEEDSFGSG
jgi:hypothetical protein